MTKRTFAIGDIHGGLKALIQVLNQLEITEEDTLIFMGDYVDGWSESSEVIQYLIDLQKDSNRHIFIKGNHDEWCNQWLHTGVKNPKWVEQGGKATYDSYLKTGYLVEDDHRKFFRSLHNYYIDDQNRGFVHGGFNSRKGLGHENYKSDYYWDRDLWTLALLSHNKVHFNDGIPHERRFEKHKEIFIGHTATVNWKNKPHLPEYTNLMQTNKNGPITVPMNRCNVWNMDTGGGFMGKLSIMDIDTKQVWQSDSIEDLYPEESGR